MKILLFKKEKCTYRIPNNPSIKIIWWSEIRGHSQITVLGEGEGRDNVTICYNGLGGGGGGGGLYSCVIFSINRYYIYHTFFGISKYSSRSISKKLEVFNKLPVWHIDGTTVVKCIWFLASTNFQTLCVKISWQSYV